MLHYFGTDGFRGEAGKTLTASQAFRIGRFLGHYYQKGGNRVRVVVGKDTRRSSYMLEYALASGLCASGADVYRLHVISTPCVCHATQEGDFDCGVMISASHNPFFDNGIKIINSRGEKMEDEVLAKIEEYLDRDGDDLPLVTGSEIGSVFDYSEGRQRYRNRLLSLAKHSFAGLRIGLDCANGSAWEIAREVFEALGAQIHTIGTTPDGININKGVGSTHIEALSALVRQHHLDAGFAFDGDADRCLAVDEQGRVITGDHILYIFAADWQRRGMLSGNTVVSTVMSNMGLYRALDEAGIRHVETPVGDKHVYDCMVKEGYSLGGEQSGHIILGQYATTGDGLLTATQLAKVMTSRRLPLSRLAGAVRLYPQVLRNLSVSDQEAVLRNPTVRKAVEQATVSLGQQGRILLRKSGTEPVVRVMVEAEREEWCRHWADHICESIRAQGFLCERGR